MDDPQVSEIQRLNEKLKSISLPPILYEKASDQIKRVNLSLKYGGNINQLEIVWRYIDWITSLPWDKKTEDLLEIERAHEIMDKNHYGLQDVKKRILEYLSILKLQKQKLNALSYHAPILFFVGLAGTGKTTLAESIAEALGRKFVRIAFGGFSSAYDLRGLSKVQPEAEPGLIIKALRRAGSRNPVILLDELDRVVVESRGSIMGVLLEILDPEQNLNFIDNYIDYPFDLSQVLFIVTANNTTNISAAVMDRLEIIQMPSYSDEEKIQIAKNFILPQLLKISGITSQNLIIDDEVLHTIARRAGFDPGIRSVERYIEAIVRKVAYKIVRGDGVSFTVNAGNAKEYIE